MSVLCLIDPTAALLCRLSHGLAGDACRVAACRLAPIVRGAKRHRKHVADKEGPSMNDATLAGPSLRAGRREWIGLAVLAPPTLLVALDIGALFLALPHLSSDPAGDQRPAVVDHGRLRVHHAGRIPDHDGYPG